MKPWDDQGDDVRTLSSLVLAAKRTLNPHQAHYTFPLTTTIMMSLAIFIKRRVKFRVYKFHWSALSCATGWGPVSLSPEARARDSRPF
jgi:hypothetical protein